MAQICLHAQHAHFSMPPLHSPIRARRPAFTLDLRLLLSTVCGVVVPGFRYKADRVEQLAGMDGDVVAANVRWLGTTSQDVIAKLPDCMDRVTGTARAPRQAETPCRAYFQVVFRAACACQHALRLVNAFSSKQQAMTNMHHLVHSFVGEKIGTVPIAVNRGQWLDRRLMPPVEETAPRACTVASRAFAFPPGCFNVRACVLVATRAL